MAELVAHVQQHHQLWMAPHPTEETESVLRRYDLRTLRAWRAFRKAGLFRIAPTPSPRMLAHFSDVVDPDDIPIVASALTARPDLFVTGDRRHLHVEAVRLHLPVVTVAEARRRLRV